MIEITIFWNIGLDRRESNNNAKILVEIKTETFSTRFLSLNKAFHKSWKSLKPWNSWKSQKLSLGLDQNLKKGIQHWQWKKSPQFQNIESLGLDWYQQPRSLSIQNNFYIEASNKTVLIETYKPTKNESHFRQTPFEIESCHLCQTILFPHCRGFHFSFLFSLSD